MGPSYLEKYNTALAKSLDNKAAAIKDVLSGPLNTQQGYEMGPTTAQVTNPNIVTNINKKIFEELQNQLPQSE